MTDSVTDSVTPPLTASATAESTLQVKFAIPALVLAALFAHLGGMANGFVYDDHRFVEANSALQELTVSAALSDPGTHTSDRDRDVYRPLRALGHAFDLRRWGLDPFGFHLHSLLVHLANVVLAWLVLRRMVPGPNETVALLGAGLLAVHPLGVEVVDWISSRGDLYAVFFSLAALGLACRPRLWSALPVAALACLAVLGKESAAVLPLIAWAQLLVLPASTKSDSSAETTLPARGVQRWAGVIALAVGVMVALTLRQQALSGNTPVQTPPHGGSLISQAGWSLYGLSRSLQLVAMPGGLSVDHPQDLWVEGWPVWLRPRTLLGGLALLAPLLALALGRRTRGWFLAGWALLAWLPSGSLIVTLRSLVTDRAGYPMLVPLGALLGLGLARSPRRGLPALLALALVYGALARERVAVFRSDQTLWEDVRSHNPRSVQARLGLALAEERPERIGELLEEALAVSVPGSKLEAAALARLGDHRLRREGRVAEAVPVLERALGALQHWATLERPGTDLPATASSLALARTMLGDYARAEAVLAEAIAGDDDPLMLLVQRMILRQLRLQQEGGAEADALVEQAIADVLRIAPEHPTIAQLIARRKNAREAAHSEPPSPGARSQASDTDR